MVSEKRKKELEEQEEALVDLGLFFEMVEKEAGLRKPMAANTKTKLNLREKLGDLKELASKLKKGVKEAGTSLFIKLFVALFIPMLIFFPLNLQSMIWPLLIGFIILIIVLILLAVVGTVAGGLITRFIMNLIPSLILLLALLLITQYINCGSQSCFWILSVRFGTLGALLAFFAVLGIFILIAVVTRGAVFWVLTIIMTILLLVFIPFLSPKSYYSFCKQIPFLYGTQFCQAREVKVDPLKTVKIPVSGGINLKIETPSTLYAGEPYEFTFSLTNLYARPIFFNLTPSMISSYGSDIEFIQPFQQKVFSIEPKEYYQDALFMNPEEMTVREETCPYSTIQLAIAQGIPIENVTCSYSKPCESDRMACGKLDVFECDCVDWIKATCSKNSLKAKISVEHTAFFLGNSSIYYSEQISKPAYGYELTQGPLRVTVEFVPNPYIASIHRYRETVSMYVTFKSLGGEITIRNFNVTPLNTVIHTIDKEKQMELIEEVGTEIISCRDITEILPESLVSGTEVGGKLCDLKPPSVKTTLIDLETNEVEEVSNVTYSFIADYCGKKAANESGQTFWSTNWKKIYDAVDESGLCEILKGKESQDKQIVKNALAHVEVLVEFEYDRKMNYYSGSIVPYTRTEKCMKLAESSAA